MISPKEIEEFIRVAETDLRQNRVKSSLKGLEKVIQLDPENLEVHYLLAIACIKDGQFLRAGGHLERVIGSEFSYLHKQQAYMMLGFVYVQRELYDDAARMFETAWSYNFNNVPATAALGHVYYKLNQPEKAVEALRRALEIDPGNKNARNSLAYVLCESGGDMAEALHLARSASKMDPENPVYLDTLGWIYHKQGKEGLARDTLKRALELAHKSAGTGDTSGGKGSTGTAGNGVIGDNLVEEIKEHLRIVLNIG